MKNPRIAFVVNNAAFFVSHRLPIAVAAREAGFEVALFTGQAGSKLMEPPACDRLAKEGIRHHRALFSSAGTNVFVEMIGLAQLVYRLWRFKADIVHCASPKGILYGGIAARCARASALVIAVSGMGFMFTGTASKSKYLLRQIYTWVARFSYGHPNKRVIVQNQDDLSAIEKAGLADKSELVLIPGSGVDLKQFSSLDLKKRENLVVLPARLLKDKGVVEFVEAAASLRRRGCAWRFALVGTADHDNPSAVSLDQINSWVSAGIVEWWGYCEDMVSVFAQASIVCLPSYREGMPKALLEAAAAGCAVITTDVIGCREAVIDGQTADLVPARSSRALADALMALINDPKRLEKYSQAGKELAFKRFGLDAVVNRMLSIYRELIGRDAY